MWITCLKFRQSETRLWPLSLVYVGGLCAA
jgi:hypothetical protein